MPDLVLEAHRRRTPIDHPLRSITREHLEYPTENVPLIYLMIIDKLRWFGIVDYRPTVATVDSFTDKAVEVPSVSNYLGMNIYGRLVDPKNTYYGRIIPANYSADDEIRKVIAGVGTRLATSSVDLAGSYLCKFSCSGSVLSWFRDDMTTPVLTATDTDLTSGRFGSMLSIHNYDDENHPEFGRLVAPTSTHPPAMAVVEAEVIGSGTGEDPIRPNLKQELVEVNKLTNVPEFLKREAKRYEMLKNKGFTDEEIEALLGYIPQHKVDLASVTWGVFDHKPKHNTMLIVVTGDNSYMEGAIDKQVEYAKSKNLKVPKPPRDYSEAIEQHRELKKDFPEWIAGKDNYACQTLGHEVLELFQVADTYYGNIVEGIKPNAYRDVPDWEMRRTLNTWRERLKKVSVLVEERDKHIRKIEKVLKLGW